MWKSLGDLQHGTRQAGVVGADNDHRRLLAERVGHHPNEPLSRFQFWNRELFLLYELPDQGVAAADEHERRKLFRIVDLIRGYRHWNGDTGGLKSKPRGQVGRDTGRVTRCAQHDIDTIGNEIFIGIAKEPRRRVQIRQIHIRLVAAVRPATRGTTGLLVRTRDVNDHGLGRRRREVDAQQTQTLESE